MKLISLLLLSVVVGYGVARPKLEEKESSDLGLTKMDSTEINSLQNVVDGPIPEAEEKNDLITEGIQTEEEEEEEEETTTTTTVSPRKIKKRRKHHRKSTTTTPAPSEELMEDGEGEDKVGDEWNSGENASDFLDFAGPMPELNDFEHQLNMKEVKFTN